MNIDFFKKVDSEGSTFKTLPRSVQMHIMKHEEDREEFWPRLLKDKTLEKNQVKIDWDRYVDEDEEEEGFDTSALEGGSGMGGMPPGMMGGMPGMGGGPGGGMDMEALMKQMGAMGGMPGGDGGAPGGAPGEMDMAQMMSQMGAAGGAGGEEEEGEDDDDLDDLPDLEES